MARPKRTTSPEDVNEVRAAVSGLRRTRQRKEAILATELEYVLRARAVGLSWHRIAEESGMSVGAIHARYAGLNGTTVLSGATDVDIVPNLKATPKTAPKTAAKKNAKTAPKNAVR